MRAIGAWNLEPVQNGQCGKLFPLTCKSWMRFGKEAEDINVIIIYSLFAYF